VKPGKDNSHLHLCANQQGWTGNPSARSHAFNTIDADDFYGGDISLRIPPGGRPGRWPSAWMAIVPVSQLPFLGWQIHLLNRGRQYFKNCTISGHVDFIFGAATGMVREMPVFIVRGWLHHCRSPHRLDQPLDLFSQIAKSPRTNRSANLFGPALRINGHGFS